MPSPSAVPMRPPAPLLPPPADRVGLTFGADTSNYRQLFGPNGMSYVPLVTAARAGIKWIRIDADRSSFFGPSPSRNYAEYGQFVDRLLAAGFDAHIIVTDFSRVAAERRTVLTTLSWKVPLLRSNIYLAAEIAPDSGHFLPVRSSVRTGGGPGALTITATTFFDPPTEMARLDPPSSTSGVFQIDYLAPPEWCTP